jgi:fructose-1,6-bisphosphatase
MENELDIVQYVSSLRLSSFISRMKLSTYQRYFINKFRTFHISSDEMENDQIAKLDKEEDDLIEAGYTDQLRNMNKAQEMVD